MTAYNTLLAKANAPSNHLIVVSPRKRVTAWTLSAGSVYVADFSLDLFGEVRRVEQDGAALTMGSSASLSAGGFWHDIDNDLLYVRMTDSSNPSTKFVTASFEVYVGTLDVSTFRVPTDSSTRQVYFHPIVTKTPSRKDTVKEVLFGYSPDQRDSLDLANGKQKFERMLFDCSFSEAPIQVYHWLGDARTENNAESRKRIITGFCKDTSYLQSGGKVSVQIFDQRSAFGKEFRNEGATSFLGSDTFADLDPQHEGARLRRVYGVVDGAKVYNIDFNDTAPDDTNNRVWLAAAGDSNLGTVTRTVGATASTATRTYLTSVVGLRVGDTFLNNDTTESAKITAVGANYVDHTTVVTPASAAETITRAAVGAVTIIQNQVKYEALYGRDYTLTTFGAEDAFGFTFDALLATNLSLPSELTPSDIVYARIYGQKNDVTLDGSPFGADDAESGNLAQGVVVLLDVLKRYAGIDEADINIASFTAVQAAQPHSVGFSIPARQGDQFPKLTDVITKLCKSTLMKLFVNKDAKWELALTAPMGAADETITTEEIQDNSLEYRFTYSEKVYSRIEVEYGAREVHSNPGVSSDEIFTAVATSDVARYLHKIEKTETFDALLFKESEAQELADHLAAALGDRRGEVTFQTSQKRFFNTALGDRIDVSKIRLPSPNFDNVTTLTQAVSVEETDQDLQGIKITASDQKGIEDALSW